MTDNIREFDCDHCHDFTFKALQPDDIHTVFLKDQCCEESVEQFFDCENCDKRSFRYWCIEHPSHVGGYLGSAGVDVREGLSSKYTDPF